MGALLQRCSQTGSDSVPTKHPPEPVKDSTPQSCSHSDMEDRDEQDVKDMAEDQFIRQVSPYHIAYDFDADKMKDILISGWFRRHGLPNISDETMAMISDYCEELICLFIPLLNKTDVVRITVHRTCSVYTLKQIIHDKTGIPIDQQILQTTEGVKQLHDDVSIEEYGLAHTMEHLTLHHSYLNVFDD